MHQEHNIPWDTLASNFEYVHEDRRFTPPLTGFTALRRPTQTKELNHFVRKMISTIREFSVTERNKYPPSQDLRPSPDGLLFSDDLRDQYPEYLNAKNQRIYFWIDSASYPPTSSGDLADVVKILIHKNQMETLLILANQPYVHLSSLRHLSWGHHFGFKRIVEAALVPYIFWNFMAASGRLASGDYKGVVYECMLSEVTRTMDHEAQQVPHWEFYGGRNLPNASLKGLPDVSADQIHQYVKHLFTLLYRYDMLARECKINPDWENEIVPSISLHYGVTYETVQEADGRWVSHF